MLLPEKNNKSYKDEDIVEPVSEESILLMMAENQSLKQQLERLHIIIKQYSHCPAVVEYLQKYNVK